MTEAIQQTVLAILQDLTGEDLSERMDEDIFETALLDSMDTVQMVLALEEQLGVDIPVSEFERDQWATVTKIVAQVQALQA
ncbi:D-alanine-poly(phosphoribitol) ligase subunit 2 [Secundilactobacillus oryzae JCM 18671]|uniref:D-alanyl carrier protein n=1 Tax=Secundilactobacillus oryzae JCM 18671 TaxID=1291743 RepID=A0A081BKG4_9LACO|nr:D-alanine--poly(phosphoribitol) ligase subunit DltC [Secundilactobacillus oryzae]GAK48532.1 D-alanine-poly(phosphoribitol) ligase subunit 2 [Secundilactobacillus oryzae JCM 18671]